MSENKKKFDIRERSFDYALRAIKLFQHVNEENSGVGKIIGKQFLRSATAVGAQVEEAQASEIQPDFIHKMSIACKEARESLYWLRLLEKAEIISETRLLSIIQETDEIIAVLTSIIKNTKNNKT